MKPIMRSNASIFADRGDPWVSAKEGRTLYGRGLATENPDLDMHTRAKKAEEHHERGSEKRQDTSASLARKLATIGMRMRKAMKPSVPIKVRESRVLPPPPVLRKISKTATGFYLYSRMIDGSEEEAERKNRPAAMRSFERLTLRPDVAVAELWNNGTGELMKSYEVSPKKRGK